MKNKIMFVFLVMFALCHNAVGFEANVSRTVIPEGESFQLYLRQDGTGEKPDISVLNEDFLITMERKSFKSTYVNGKAQSFNENVLTLIPKKTGQVVLPSIRAGKEKTKPITLTVVAGGQALPDDPDSKEKAKTVQANVFIRYSLENKSPYIGEQIPLTVKLYSFVQTPLLDGSVIPPRADGVTAEQWDDVKRRKEVVNNRTYDVLEYKFLLFAQKSGKIELSPAQFRGSVSDPSASPDGMDDFFSMNGGGLFSGFFNQKNIAVQSETITLNIKPIPSGSTGAWLPATDVSVSEDLTPSKQTITLGEALTRTVTVMASGVQDTQIPDLVFTNAKGYKQYPGRTDSKNLFDNNGVVGVKTRQIVFMPTVSGKMVLPEMRIPWFDVKSGKTKQAVLPSRTITVEAAEGGSVSVPSAQISEPIENNEVVVEPVPVKEESEFARAFSETPDNTAEQKAAQAFWKRYVHQSPLRLFLAGIFAGGAAVLVLWLSVYFLIFNKVKKKQISVNQKEKDSVSVKNIHEACLSGSAMRVKDSLLTWARFYWSENPPLTVSDAVGRLNAQDLIKEAELLNKSLYGENKNEWNGEKFWQAFKNAVEKNKNEQKDEKIPVPPLYPN